MKMSTILGGVASSAVIIASAFIYGTAQKAEAAIDKPNIVYVNRLVEKVVYVEEFNPEAIFANISNEDRNCLALNVYFESRGESKIGQEFVAWVTLNRVTSDKFPNNVCDVVWEDKQFSWTHDGKSDKPKDQEAWSIAQQIAGQVIDTYGVESDPTEGAIFFHSDYVNPYWTDKVTKVVQIDNHIFYKEESS
jgi:spore germination cell wall hydrolase CwlJ-like protein